VLTKRVCLVLGAGASAPYGFPTGAQLLDFADHPDDGWWPLAAQLLRATPEYHREFVRERRVSGAESLDEFVGRQARFKEYAKLLIAYRIGQAEQRDNIIGATGGPLDWMTFFIRRLIEGVQLEDLGKAQLSVVTFNFDRCFEETLFLRLSANYRMPDESAAQARMRIATAYKDWQWPIVHVHGSLGPLEDLAGPGRAYEPTHDPEKVEGAAQRLTLLDEAQQDSQLFQRARQLIRTSEVTLFLGFGFHRLNCRRVLPSPWDPAQPAVYGTVQGMSAGRIRKAKDYFRTGDPRGGPTPQLFPEECLTLLREFEDIFSD